MEELLPTELVTKARNVFLTTQKALVAPVGRRVTKEAREAVQTHQASFAGDRQIAPRMLTGKDPAMMTMTILRIVFYSAFEPQLVALTIVPPLSLLPLKERDEVQPRKTWAKG
jgi:hypothetical protein